MAQQTLQRTLRGAVAGENVRGLQQTLRAAGFAPGLEDGIYGPITATAVRRFQEEAGLRADEVVDERTWRALADTSAGARLAKIPLGKTLHGATGGADVLQAQRALAGAGHDPGMLDGVYGPRTEEAVRSFRATGGLLVDGLIGPETWNALTAGGASPDALPGVATDPLPGVVLIYLAGDGAPPPILVDPLKDRVNLALFNPDIGFFPNPDLFEQADAFIVLISPKFLAFDWRNLTQIQRALARAREGEAVLAPVLLEQTDWEWTPFFEFQSSFPHPQAVRDSSDLTPALARFLELVDDVRFRPSSPRGTLPGFSADRPEGVDLLGVEDRVNFLASVLAAKELDTPLAVGLFGDWGSGKSFFMRRLEERLAELAEQSVRAERDGDPTYYCSHIRQVTFNAWLYSSGDIWPSFAAHVFRALAGTPDAGSASLADGDLGAYQRQLANELGDVVDRLRSTENEETALERRLDELDRELADKRASLTKRAAALGPEAAASAQAVADLSEGASGLRLAVEAIRSLRPTQLATTVAPLLIAVAFAVIAVVAPGRLAAAAVVLAAMSALVSIFSRSVRYVGEATRLQVQIQRLEDEKTSVRREREIQAARRAKLDQRLESEPALPLLPKYVEDQATRWTEREHMSVVTEIRLRFERLSRLIEHTRARSTSDDDSGTSALPIDRVIIYIDDLDRCHASVVVGVLETIKLVVDLPHFVVVVGVDSRWLVRSLRVHFAEELGAHIGLEDTEPLPATPQNYLEKIFQYSLVLRPLEERGFQRLLASVLATDSKAADTQSKPTKDDQDSVAVTVPTVLDVVEPDRSGPVSGDDRLTLAPDREAEALVDLTPRDLVITPDELGFMTRLAGLFVTPRSAKRFANVYRFARVAIGAERLARPADHEPFLTLLGVAITSPAIASDLFGAISARPDAKWDDFLDGLAPSPGDGGLHNVVSDDLSASEAAVWTRLAWALRRSARPDRTLGDYGRWIDLAREFSFHPWRSPLESQPAIGRLDGAPPPK